MRAWNRGTAVLLVALALVILIKAKPILGEERRMESQILSEVSNQLAKEDRFQNLRVEAEDCIVRLRGTVAVLEDRRQAVWKAGEVNGVRIVLHDALSRSLWLWSSLVRLEKPARLPLGGSGIWL